MFCFSKFDKSTSGLILDPIGLSGLFKNARKQIADATLKSIPSRKGEVTNWPEEKKSAFSKLNWEFVFISSSTTRK